MESWAEREVEIACKREAPDREPGEWDYGCACYESALKAFNSLCEDGHSGFSIGMTKQILNRLIECKPLTSIEDTEDVWDNTTDFGGHRGEVANYQCKRMSSLFKYVYALICRICKCIEHCATARAYSKLRENGVMTKMSDVEAGIIKIGKEKEDARKNVES